MAGKMAYVGRRPCGCVESVVLDDPTRASLLLDTLAEMRARGLQITQMSAEEADRRGLEHCAKHRAPEDGRD